MHNESDVIDPVNRHQRRAAEAIARHDDELLTTEELAEIRKIPASRINKERMTGDGCPYIKDGHLVRYRWGDYCEWIASKPRLTATPPNPRPPGQRGGRRPVSQPAAA